MGTTNLDPPPPLHYYSLSFTYSGNLEKSMQSAESRFANLLAKTVAIPDITFDSAAIISLVDDLIEEFRPAQDQWLARATVFRHALRPFDDGHDDVLTQKSAVLQIYKDLVSAHPIDVELLLEACRAHLVFEDTRGASDLLNAGFKLLRLSSELSAVEVRLTKYQPTATLRLSCLVTCSEPGQNECKDSIDYVPLHSDSQLDRPEFLNSEVEKRCTQRLSDLAYVALLLQAEISAVDAPLSSESALMPYVRRVTESNDFEKIAWAIQEHALYSRSLHESGDIEHLERGTVQLIKISDSLHAVDANREGRLKYVHLLPPLPWMRVEEMTARRLVAMSDFANAVAFYQRLSQPLELGMCYAAIGETQKATEALSVPELANSARAVMIKGDLEQNAAHWEQAWVLGKLPEAKLRLAQQAAGGDNAPAVQAHLNELLEVFPSNRDALCLSGVTALGTQNWSYAAKQLRRALAINEDDQRAWSNLSTALVYLEEPEQALVALKQAIRVDKNGQKDMKTLSNFVALSAQLAHYDDVVVGISQLCEQVDRGSAQYVARVASVFPRLVTHFITQPFTNSVMQSRVVELFRSDLRRAIPEDDPTIARLTGKLEFWTGRYWAGLASYDTAVKSCFRFAESAGGKREWMRVTLYAAEYADALEKYGDQEGRIEGSKACPDWKSKRAAALKLVEKSSHI